MNTSTQSRGRRIRTRLTPLAVTVGMVLASLSAVLTVATPADAAVVQVVAAAAAATPSQSATAVCPMGQWLSGGAGQITGGGNDVTLTDIIPNLANRSVTVWAHTNPGGMPAYNVVAQAICRPNPPPPNYGLVQAASPLNGANHKTVQAICPEGTRLLGTGAELQQAFGRAFYRSIEPDSGLTMNTVRADEAFALGNWRAIAYAICGTLPHGAPAPVRLAAVSAFNPVNVKSIATGVCPGGRHTTGVGGHADPAPTIAGFVFIDEIIANAAQDQATAGALEGVNPGAGVPWDVTAYNICW